MADALILGRVGTGRTRALGLGQSDLAGEGCIDHRVSGFDREPERRHREPVEAQADFGVGEARIAHRGRCDHDGLYRSPAATAEIAAGDHGVVVLELAPAAVHDDVKLRRDPVLEGQTKSPAGGQLDARAIDIDAIGGDTERDVVAGPEQARAVQVGAAGIFGGALAIVEIAAEAVTLPSRVPPGGTERAGLRW